ncbi:hypothetical protein MCRY_18310 [Marivita cryptomonadis]|nr:hypothetical protein MCRY_18310 [Marivita cryptomonadis]
MLDDFGLVEAVDRLCESIVVRVSNAANRGTDFGVFKTFSILDGQVLNAAITVVGEPVTIRISGSKRLVKSV